MITKQMILIAYGEWRKEAEYGLYCMNHICEYWASVKYSIVGRKNTRMRTKQFFIENNICFFEASKGAIYDILMKNTDISEPVVLSIDRNNQSKNLST